MAVKTINGIPIANIKTINGIPIANIKTINGVSVSTTYIVSVQPVSITIAQNSTTNTATISSVNTAYAVLFLGGMTSGGNAASNYGTSLARIELTNATTVSAFRFDVSTTNDMTITGTVVEFASSMIQSIQAGTIDLSNGVATNTATLGTAVTVANTVAIYLGGVSTASGQQSNRYLGRVSVTNTTTITGTRVASSTPGVIVGFMAVEFKSGVLAQAVQQVSFASSSTSASETTTITSVDTDNTLLVNGGQTWGNSTFTGLDTATRFGLQDATTIAFDRVGTAATGRTINVAVVEFVSGILASNQRGNIVLASVASNTATITAVNTAKSFVCFNGYSTNATVATAREMLANVVLTDSTTVTAAKSLGGTTSSTANYEVPEFV